MVVIGVGTVTFFKAIVLRIGLLESQIVDERHFKTECEAMQFKRNMELESNDLVCMVYQM